MVGGTLWMLDRKVVWFEWLIGSGIGFVTAGIFHLIALNGATADVETWSGQLVQGYHTARWEEYYEEAVYRTEYYTTVERNANGKGTHTERHSRQVFDHWSAQQRWHDDDYQVASNIGTSHEVDHAFFDKVAETFGGYIPVRGYRHTNEHASKMIAGDPNDYTTHNQKGFVWPVTKHVSFENKVRATPTTFSYAPVPEGTKVFEYPPNQDPFHSDRLLGSATLVDHFAFDQMNARLGPARRVNVILVGFGTGGSMLAKWQESKWVGGKKNDVVVCFGGSNAKPDWVEAFGWTDAKVCLRSLESIILEHGAVNESLPLIEQEIIADYKLKDWSQFDYIQVPAPMWTLWVYLLAMVLGQGGYWWWANCNDFNKGR